MAQEQASGEDRQDRERQDPNEFFLSIEVYEGNPNEYIRLTTPRRFADQLVEMSHENGIRYRPLREHTMGENGMEWLTLYAELQAAGTIGALATVIIAYLRRNKGNKITVNSEEITLEGYSTREAMRIIEQAYRQRLEGPVAELLKQDESQAIEATRSPEDS